MIMSSDMTIKINIYNSMPRSNVDVNDSKSKLNPPPRQGPHSNLSNKFLLPAGSSGPVQGTMWQNANWSGAGARHSEQTVRARGQLLTRSV